MATHVSRLRASAVIGVGAAFDFHAGTVPWAPAWIRRAGLEWAYRLAHEPRRLWRRNLDSLVFLARIVAQRMGRTVAPQRRSLTSISPEYHPESPGNTGQNAPSLDCRVHSDPVG